MPYNRMQVRGKRDGVPVSLLVSKWSRSKFANWPNSAGMRPGGIQNAVKTYKNKSRYRTGTIWLRKQAYALILKASQGKRDGVPVSSFHCNCRIFKFANWPNSAGMGPGVYKTQSKHTKIKSRYRTGTIWLRNASLFLNIEYLPVNEQDQRSNLSMLSNSPMFEGRVNPMFPFQLMFTPFVFILMIDVGSSPERIQNSVKTCKKQVTLSYWYDFTEERKPMP